MGNAQFVSPLDATPARCVACGEIFFSDSLMFEHMLNVKDPKTGKKKRRCMTLQELGAQLHQDKRGIWNFKF